jgi:hypothetical protein
MARSQFYDVIGLRTSSTGTNFDGLWQALADIRVTVRQAGFISTATIYDSQTASTPRSNPFNTTDGRVEFWAEFGEYDIIYEDVTGANRVPQRVYRWSPSSSADTLAYAKRRTGLWQSNQVERAPAVYFDWATETLTPDIAYMQRVAGIAPATNGFVRINKSGVYLVSVTAFTMAIPPQGTAHAVELRINNGVALDSSSFVSPSTGQTTSNNLTYHGPLAANDLVGAVTILTSTDQTRPSFLRITHLGDI